MKLFALVYAPLALEDINEIVCWYEEKQKGLGDKFFDSLFDSEKFQKKILFGFQSRYKETREAIIPTFPYMLIYSVENNVIYIHSIFPTKRNPKKKYFKVLKPSKQNE
jgi:hypothetical protein